MSKKKLFDEDSEDEVAIKTENEYAKKYDAWREKEELHKLEQKYGPKALNSDASSTSDSEDESDEPVEVTEEVEKQFLKTLTLLKTKDPRIYDPTYKFFDEKLEKQKEKEPETKTLTFDDSDDDDDGDPNIFVIEKKAEIGSDDDSKKTSSKEDKLKDYLTGKVEHVDRELESDLAPLRALWSDPKINNGEAFLRDYILNKRYLEQGDAGEATDQIRDDEDLEEDEKLVEEQGKFERAYNFRFEEPDDEYLKRFPRTMNYIRPKDDRRSRKRADRSTRKEEEKRQKMEEIARMKALKLKEIQEKIAKIKEVTGNQELAFEEEDIDGDFNPEEHDRRMKALFDEQYYGEVDEQKPVFPDLDEELEIENWENYEQEQDQGNEDAIEEGPHCEDENFNMDADYDPKRAKENLLEELKRNMGKKRRNRKRKSKLAELLGDEKPKFVPDFDKKYSEFMEEYYKMDCEDVIGGDLPTRFKYRDVVPNDFGLTIEEILLADDKELTQWVPLKKITKYRPENVEKGEVKVYSQKATDDKLKKKILPSLYKDLPEKPEIVVPQEELSKKKKKKKKKNKEDTNVEEAESNINREDTLNENIVELGKKKKMHINNKEFNEHIDISESDTNATSDNIEKTKKKKKRKPDKNIENENANENIEVILNENHTGEEIKHSKKNKTQNETFNSNINHTSDIHYESSVNANKKFNKKKKPKNAFSVDAVMNETPAKMTNNNANEENEGKKKKKHNNSFVIEPLDNTINHSNTNKANKVKAEEQIKNKLKRKIEPGLNTNVPKKKRKRNKNKQDNSQSQNTQNDSRKDIKRKYKTTKSSDQTDNPLSNLSDERLKAYGLNPKKYRGFLKYKKF